jgi:hypothetical protein
MKVFDQQNHQGDKIIHFRFQIARFDFTWFVSFDNYGIASSRFSIKGDFQAYKKNFSFLLYQDVPIIQKWCVVQSTCFSRSPCRKKFFVKNITRSFYKFKWSRTIRNITTFQDELHCEKAMVWIINIVRTTVTNFVQ